MDPRGTDALPLPPRPNIEQYRNRAKSLAKACQSYEAAVRTWAREWLEALAALHDTGDASDVADDVRHLRSSEIEREVEKIARDARASGLLTDAAAGASCTLSDAQLFLARLHDFASWPKFAQHVEALAAAS